MNNELLSLYKAEKQERLNQPKVNTPEYNAMRGRDLERRERVMKFSQQMNCIHRPLIYAIIDISSGCFHR
jgi:hypothetical protein